MRLRVLLVVVLSVIPRLGLANDFPTQARVEFVLGCMEDHGGQSYDTLYPCVCVIDKIAERMTYKEYEHADTMSVMITTPGERGGAFRDAPGARKEVRNLRRIREEAERVCSAGQKKSG